jgi:hypothetical protein
MISTIDKERRYDSAPSFNSAAFKCRAAYSRQKIANPATVSDSVKTAKQVKVHL